MIVPVVPMALTKWVISPPVCFHSSGPVLSICARGLSGLENWSSTLPRSEEHTSELQSLMRISYAVFCLKKKNIQAQTQHAKVQIITHNADALINVQIHL